MCDGGIAGDLATIFMEEKQTQTGRMLDKLRLFGGGVIFVF